MIKYQIIDVINKSFKASNGPIKKRTLQQINTVMIHHAGVNRMSFEALKISHLQHDHKWPSIGYHYYIEKSGAILKCNEIYSVTNGCLNYNTQCIHVCFEGNYEYDNFDHNFNDIMLLLLSDFGNKVHIKYFIPHSDKRETLCCGKILKGILDKWRLDLIGKNMSLWPEFY